MGRINLGRVILGGLVAGLAIGSVVLWKDRREWRDVQLICP